VVLEVVGPEAAGAEQPAAAKLDEARGEPQVGVLAGEPVELDERRLDLGVPVDRLLARLAEAPHEQVGEARRNREQVCPAGGPRDRNGGLHEVAGAVHLVAPVELAQLRSGWTPW
jgi:hypothetical protein